MSELKCPHCQNKIVVYTAKENNEESILDFPDHIRQTHGHNLLRELMSYRNVSIENLSELSGLTPSSICSMRSGKIGIGDRSALKLAKWLNYPLYQQFLSREDKND